MELRTEPQPDAAAVVTVSGDIDMFSAPDLRAYLAELSESGTTNIVVDLNKVDFLDSSALGALIGVQKQLRAVGGGFRLACNHPKIERLFAPVDEEVFRKALTQKYGPVADARSGGTFALGWGPSVDSTLVYDRSGPRQALTARYEIDSDFMREGLNEADDVRLVLTLVDAAWAAKNAK